MSLERLKEVISLLANSTIVELKYSEGDIHISLVRRLPGDANASSTSSERAAPSPQPKRLESEPAPAAQAAVVAPAPAMALTDGEGDDVVVTAPMASLFHRSPSPNADPFVEIGDSCAPGDKLCILEAMKVYTVLDAECAGTIAEIYVKDGDEVGVDQPLIRIRRS